MGKYDSSKTRVVPVFEALLKADPTGKTWISRVLELPHREGRLPAPEVLNGSLTAYAWGDHEKRLNAPTALLEHLIDNPGSVGDPRILGSGRSAGMRAALVAGDSEVVAGAKRLIRSGDRTRGWQVLEGPSQPDVYLETPEVVVVIEGKRTEAGPTTQTTWMPIRHQMLRHIDCAWELRGTRPVFGFFIVEGDEQGELPTEWTGFVDSTVRPNVLAASLPHRSGAEREDMAQGFLGATTWQRVCEEFEIDWSKIPDEVPE